MSSKNITYNHYFIGFANLNGNKGEVFVEHYFAKDPVDCMRQCLQKHDVFVHPTLTTAQSMMTLADHNNFLLSYPRKVKVTII